MLLQSEQRTLWTDDDEGDGAKRHGAYYTPEYVVRSLVSWVARRKADSLLDPACGDGRFLRAHSNSFGVEQSELAVREIRTDSPSSRIHHGDFFSWALSCDDRFDCAAGNPPFIRYQRFSGPTRETAIEYCRARGVKLTRLASSWAPFLVGAATLLKPGGSMGFVVPAEIGHAPYAAPVIEYLVGHFDVVHVIAIREKIFPELSEDCWLLFTSGFGGKCKSLRFTALEQFHPSRFPPQRWSEIRVEEWRKWNSRLRPFLLSSQARDLYRTEIENRKAIKLGSIARVGIGYVTGANDFFHLRPSQSRCLEIPRNLLHATVRNGRSLATGDINDSRVKSWIEADDPVLLLRLNRDNNLPSTVRRYLDSEAGKVARTSYKCRNRDPWFVVPDVRVPDGFLSYMSGGTPALVANDAGCVCTNSVHAVHLNPGHSISQLRRVWRSELTALSCEIEGHPLGGGMLKLEPREASQVLLGEKQATQPRNTRLLVEATAEIRRWRHYAG